jgi:hypothetical protein
MDHPTNTELVSERSEICSPKSILHTHFDAAACRKFGEKPISLFRVLGFIMIWELFP